MEVVFCVNYTSSITSYFGQIRAMILFICGIILQIQGNIRIGLIKFRSSYDLWNINVHGFTGNIGILQQWLDNDEPGGVSPDGYEAVGDGLHAALNVGWHANSNDQVFKEKLVILITDGAPNGLFTPLIGEDPWIISNRFIEQNITLIVVGVEKSVLVCDDFYCALAQKTGGAYIPLANAQRILSNIIQSVMNEGDTFRQAFRHVMIEELEQDSSFKYSAMKGRVDGMIKECKTMDDIRKLFFNHRSSNI